MSLKQKQSSSNKSSMKKKIKAEDLTNIYAGEGGLDPYNETPPIMDSPGLTGQDSGNVI